jgi:hypothetical protein
MEPSATNAVQETVLTVDQPISNAAPMPAAEDPRELSRQIQFFTHVQKCAAVRKARAEELMQRRVAKTWDAVKKAKMVRRLVTASQELNQASDALDQLQLRLSQVTVEPTKVNDVAPFIPAPPTSV